MHFNAFEMQEWKNAYQDDIEVQLSFNFIETRKSRK